MKSLYTTIVYPGAAYIQHGSTDSMDDSKRKNKGLAQIIYKSMKYTSFLISKYLKHVSVDAIMGTLARVRACTHSTKKTNCDITRRTLFLMAGSTLVSTSASSAVAEDPSLARNSPTPYQRGQNLEYGLNSDGRIRSCDAAAQPNCVSTSSLSELYSPPWTVSRDNKKCGPSCMMEEFDDILHDMNPGASLISETKSKKGGLYRRYRIPSAFNYDMVE
jgi:hypothetical protein